MKQYNDWTNRLRDRLRDAELTPPEQGAARLDEALRTLVPPARRRPGSLLPSRYRLPVAAALLLGVLLTGFLLRPADLLRPESTGPMTALLSPVEPTPTERTPAEETPAHAGTGLRRDNPAAAHSPLPALHPEPTGTHDAPHSETAQTTGPDTRRSEATPTDDTPQPTGNNRPTTAVGPASGSARDDRRAYAEAIRPRPAAGTAVRRRTSLGLFGSGSLRSDAGRPAGSPAFLIQQSTANGITFDTGHADLAASRRTAYAHSRFDHRRPWSLGLSLRKEFKYGLSLETGLVYTRLASEVTASGHTVDQQLHLLGVPLRLNWAFVDRPRAALYLGAGGMLERCLRARLDGERRSENGLQASLGAVVGAEYRFTRSAALYAEPEWSCFLTETDLRTIRTDRPVTFTLRVGVRFTF